MIFVALVHIQRTVYVGIHKQRIISQCSAYIQVIAHSVAFNIGFIYDVDAIPVTQFVEAFLLRVVTGTYGVYIVLFPKFEVFQHEIFGDVMSGVFIVLVIVDSFHEDRPAVYHELLVFYLYGTKTYFAAGGFNNVSVDVFQADNECIEVRCFGCPLQRFFDCFGVEFYFCLSVAYAD